MKYLIVPVLALFLIGCDAPVPMSDAEAKAFNACLEKGWKPKFFANNTQRDLTCERK